MSLLWLLLQLMVGKAKYQCSCVRYLLPDHTALIVSLSVGLELLFIIIVVLIQVIILYYRRRQSSPAEQGASGVSMDQDTYYTRHLADDEIGYRSV